jgi:predicted nucleic acid-binding protein
MIYIDASFLIAIFLENDQWHERALILKKGILNEKAILSPFVLPEVINLVGKLSGGKVAYNCYKFIRHNFIINRDTLGLYDEAIDIHLKYDGTLSLVDAINLKIMEDLSIKKIYSFDSDFDKIEGITRVY